MTGTLGSTRLPPEDTIKSSPVWMANRRTMGRLLSERVIRRSPLVSRAIWRGTPPMRLETTVRSPLVGWMRKSARWAASVSKMSPSDKVIVSPGWRLLSDEPQATAKQTNSRQISKRFMTASPIDK